MWLQLCKFSSTSFLVDVSCNWMSLFPRSIKLLLYYWIFPRSIIILLHYSWCVCSDNSLWLRVANEYVNKLGSAHLIIIIKASLSNHIRGPTTREFTSIFIAMNLISWTSNCLCKHQYTHLLQSYNPIFSFELKFN